MLKEVKDMDSDGSSLRRRPVDMGSAMSKGAALP